MQKKITTNLPTPICSFSENGELLHINKAFTKIFGYDQNDILHLSDLISKIQSEEERVKYENFIQELITVEDLEQENLAASYETVIKTKMTTNRDVQVYATFVNREILLLFADITKIKSFQKELIEAKMTAERNNAIKDQLLSNVSHEIRTPMNGVIGFTELLDDELLTKEKRKEYLNIIKSNGEHILKLIDDILDSSHIESGIGFSIKTEFFNLEQFSKEVFYNIKNFHNREGSSSTILTVNPQNNVSGIVCYSDKYRLKQIINNIAINAIKYTEKGFIEVTLENEDNKFLVLKVKDTGAGISKENLQKIFKRLYRIDENVSSGYGIGLSITKHLIEKLNGTVEVQSEINQGTTFTVRIPAIFKKEEQASDLKTTVKARKKDKSTIKILVAEDDIVNRFYLKSIFDKQKNFHYTIVEDGHEAVEICKKESFDIIILDITMPKLDGFECSKEILKNKPKAKIIIQSAHTKSSDIKLSKDIGVKSYLTKPIVPDVLISTIEQIHNSTL